MHCVDLVEALTRHVLGTSDSDEMSRFKRDRTDKIKQNYMVVSTTLRRYQEERALRVAVRALRRFVLYE